MNSTIESIVIVGGGSAGWMAAAYIAKKFKDTPLKITLVESAVIKTVGVGEATVPAMKTFLSDLDISEFEFIKETNATFKLGIDFEGWRVEDEKFFHPFASFGVNIAGVEFQHYWTSLKNSGEARSFDSYSLPAQMARARKFAPSKNEANTSELARFNYAYHFDAIGFADFLKKYSVAIGVEHIVATIEQVSQDPDTGNVTSLLLSDGNTLAADFYIDCSGFKGMLIEDVLHTGYEDWSKWLPCDSAVVTPSESTDYVNPYTRSIARTAGWQWEIPLQNRMGNGYVYASKYIDACDAEKELLENISGKNLADPRVLKFTAGRRKKTWNKNVFSLGLSSGFLEPLESTSIFMIQIALNVLYKYFPYRSSPQVLVDKVNSVLEDYTLKLRDFIILHYCFNEHYKKPFWDYCRNMELPDSLSARLELFKATSALDLGDNDFFKTNSWLAVFAGFGISSNYVHPKVASFTQQQVQEELDNLYDALLSSLSMLPDHTAFLKRL
jgi:tryptophan halogenase